MKIIVLLVGLLLQTGTAFSSTPEEVQLVVLKQWLQPSTDFVYCLNIDGKDADQELLQRLLRPGLDLAAASECEAVTEPREGSYHRSSHKKALFVYLKDFQQIDGHQATLTIETYHHGLWASGNTIRLALEDAQWHLVETLPSWVS